MPLGVATSMFAGMTLGIGVDFAIHLLERYRLARRRGLALEAALTDAVTATGPAIVIDALGVALGFGILTLSQVPANARLGGLVMLSIAGCLVATLVVLPALLRIWQPWAARAPDPRRDD
jgi:predicted RND superfamily exporter protein